MEESRYGEMFERYVQHVSVWVKKERIRNRITGEYEEPDEKLMQEVERLLDAKGTADDWRKQLISGIAAWAIDHPGAKVEAAVVFPQHMRRMREAIWGGKRKEVADLARDISVQVKGAGTGLSEARAAEVENTIARLVERYGYCRHCAGDAASMLVRRRFQDLVV